MMALPTVQPGVVQEQASTKPPFVLRDVGASVVGDVRCRGIGGGTCRPNGFHFHTDGTALYMAMAAPFVAQATNTNPAIRMGT